MWIGIDDAEILIEDLLFAGHRWVCRAPLGLQRAAGRPNARWAFFSVLGTRPGGARAGGAPHKGGGGLGKRAARGLGGPVGWCPEDVGGVAWWLKRA